MLKHFLIDCIEYSHVRHLFFQTNDLRYLFQDVPADKTLMFLNHINLLTNYTIYFFKFVQVLHFHSYMTYPYSRFIAKLS